MMQPGQMSAMRAQALRMPMQSPAPMPQQGMPGVAGFGGGMPPMPGQMPKMPMPGTQNVHGMGGGY